jgi:hypothetical protein
VIRLSAMRLAACPVLMLAALVSSGCASTPKQAVQLSVTVGRDVQAVHVAHLALAQRYFDRMEADVNAFVDRTYRPYAIDRSMKAFHLMERISDPARADGLDPLDVMQGYVEALTKEIEGFRQELLRPIRAQRDTVLASLEQAYRQIQDGNAIVTGHLASLVAVQDAQDEALKQAGLPGLREKLVDATAQASDQIAELTRKGDWARGKATEVQKTIEDLRQATRGLGK